MNIKRRDFMQGLAAGMCLSGLGFPIISQASSSSRPNIVLCMADDQGWGDMGYNGHPDLKTPNFDAMASSGIRFDRFYAAAPVCSPTRGSVLTGRHPNRYGVFKWGHSLRPQEVTIAEVLKSAGYATGHFGKWHLGPVYRDSPVNPGSSGFDEWLSSPNFFDLDPILSREGTAVQVEGESSMITVEAAIDFIQKQIQASQPFLAVVWFGSPHNPYKALEQDASLYQDQPEELKQYYSEITAMDRAFGRLRGELRDLGIQENTLFFFSSDNGGLNKVSRTGGRGYKGQIYDGGLRVPAILEWPSRITSPQSTAIPCCTSDLYPTLLELLEIKVENQPPLDGISLVPLLEGKMDIRPQPIGFWDYPEQGIITPSDKLMKELLEIQKAGKDVDDPVLLQSNADQITKQYPTDSFPGHAAWLDWPWKLHRIENESVQYELYNLQTDSNEKDNVIEQNSERSKAMKSELENWQTSVIRSLNGEDYKI